MPEASLLELARYVEFLHFKGPMRQPIQKQLARDYDTLAAIYDELADEVWLPAENEALLHVEKDVAS